MSLRARSKDAVMVPYTIDFLREDGSIHETRVVVCEDDDAAIDHAGGLDHLHAMEIRQGDRHVGLVPPLSPPPFHPARRR
jgi:hypothetical protein